MEIELERLLVYNFFIPEYPGTHPLLRFMNIFQIPNFLGCLGIQSGAILHYHSNIYLFCI